MNKIHLVFLVESNKKRLIMTVANAFLDDSPLINVWQPHPILVVMAMRRFA